MKANNPSKASNGKGLRLINANTFSMRMYADVLTDQVTKKSKKMPPLS